MLLDQLHHPERECAKVPFQILQDFLPADLGTLGEESAHQTPQASQVPFQEKSLQMAQHPHYLWWGVHYHHHHQQMICQQHVCIDV